MSQANPDGISNRPRHILCLPARKEHRLPFEMGIYPSSGENVALPAETSDPARELYDYLNGLDGITCVLWIEGSEDACYFLVWPTIDVAVRLAFSRTWPPPAAGTRLHWYADPNQIPTAVSQRDETIRTI